jgi:hypothetical protein
MKITQQWIDEGKALVASGDLNISNNRARYTHLTQKVTELNDDSMLVAMMTGEPDGEEDEGFVKAVEDIEVNGFQIEEAKADEGSLATDEDFSRSSHHSG